MKNILIIIKLDYVKKQPSDNRLNFLNYLSKKKNIKLMNDTNKITIKKWISSTKKRVNWEPDIVIYYFLSSHQVWTNVSVVDLINYSGKKYMIFEDHHYHQVAIPLFKKYKFQKLIKPSREIKSEIQYKKNNVPFETWGFFFNTDNFKIRDTKYKYHILLYGFIHPQVYPLRKKYYEVLKYIQNKYPQIKIKIIEHPGYNNNDYNKIPKNAELSEIIGQSRFTFVSSSIWRMLLKKYYEVPLSGSTIIGDMPQCANNLQDKMIQLDFNSSHQNILNVLNDAINNKFIDIENKSRQWASDLSNKVNFEAGYVKLCDICK